MLISGLLLLSFLFRTGLINIQPVNFFPFDVWIHDYSWHRWLDTRWDVSGWMSVKREETQSPLVLIWLSWYLVDVHSPRLMMLFSLSVMSSLALEFHENEAHDSS